MHRAQAALVLLLAAGILRRLGLRGTSDQVANENSDNQSHCQKQKECSLVKLPDPAMCMVVVVM
jgi:hypothetical protein